MWFFRSQVNRLRVLDPGVQGLWLELVDVRFRF